MIIGGVGVGGGGGVLTFLTSTSFTLRKMHTLRMLSYDHQGRWGVGGVLTSLTSTSFTLRKMQTLHMLSVVPKIIPTKGSSWPKPTTNKISLLRLRLIIFEVVCGINPIEPLLLVPNKWMEHGNTWKNGDLRRCSTKKNKTCTKKVHLGLQLDMASQRCLVADCGFCIATSALAPLASRRGKNWKSECRPDMIRMIENHKFLMFFSWPLKSKIESPRRRNAHFHSLVTHLPIEMNVHVANIFWRPLQIPAFCLLASKIRISNSSPLQGRRVNRLPCFSHCSHMFLTRREPGVPLSLFRPYPLPFSPPFLLYCPLPFLFSSMSFSLIYICCSFRGGILSVVFPTVARCFWPAGNLGCPCLFSDLVLFPFLLLLFCIFPCPSFSSMSFSLRNICCSFRGGILSVVFPTVAICFWPAGNLECPCLFSDLILFPFLLLFFYIVPYPSFSSMSFSLIYIFCSFRGGILSVVFPAVAICVWPAGNLECPCLFSDLILFPFLLLFFYIVPYPSCSSMSFSLIYICCSFRGGILSVVFPTVARCFWPAGNLECPCLFSDLILFPFLLLFFYIVPYPSFSSMN